MVLSVTERRSYTVDRSGGLVSQKFKVRRRKRQKTDNIRATDCEVWHLLCPKTGYIWATDYGVWLCSKTAMIWTTDCEVWSLLCPKSAFIQTTDCEAWLLQTARSGASCVRKPLLSGPQIARSGASCVRKPLLSGPQITRSGCVQIPL